MATPEEIKASRKAALSKAARVPLTGEREVQLYPRHLSDEGRERYLIVFKRPKIRGKGMKKTLVGVSPEAMAALVALYEEVGDQAGDCVALDGNLVRPTVPEGKDGDK